MWKPYWNLIPAPKQRAFSIPLCNDNHHWWILFLFPFLCIFFSLLPISTTTSDCYVETTVTVIELVSASVTGRHRPQEESRVFHDDFVSVSVVHKRTRRGNTIEKIVSFSSVDLHARQYKEWTNGLKKNTNFCLVHLKSKMALAHSISRVPVLFIYIYFLDNIYS